MFQCVECVPLLSHDEDLHVDLHQPVGPHHRRHCEYPSDRRLPGAAALVPGAAVLQRYIICISIHLIEDTQWLHVSHYSRCLQRLHCSLVRNNRNVFRLNLRVDSLLAHRHQTGSILRLVSHEEVLHVSENKVSNLLATVLRLID